MRRTLLALIALACMSPAAEAARRDERGREAPRAAQQQEHKPQQVKAAPAQRSSAASAPRRQAASRGSARQQTAALAPGDVRTSRSSLVVRGAAAATVSRDAMASCTRRNGRTVCGGGSSVAGWQAGLPSVSYAQRECPEGTFATLARGHEDVVRCMPL